jgi:hypothetical protein
LIALGVACAYVFHSQQEFRSLSSGLRSFDQHARETVDAIAELRAGQQAYVAAGQGVDFWMPKVAATATAVRNNILVLRQSATSGTALAGLMEGEAAIAEFDAVDKRAREYIQSGDQLMAGDVIFTEGVETLTSASRQVERARLAEHEALDAREAVVRTQQAVALGAAAGVTGVFVILLAFLPVRPAVESANQSVGLFKGPVPVEKAEKPLPASTQTESSARTLAAMMRTTAELCTDFGRIRDLSDLKDLLARAAKTMDASGLVVWLGSTSGADLQPVVSHGYSPAVIARMPAVPRNADNAAAAAYRTGALQIVLSRPGGTPGALVAPLLSPEGCVGALSAETRNGGEGSQAVQSLAVIFAAHLAGVFSTAANEGAETKAVAQG